MRRAITQTPVCHKTSKKSGIPREIDAAWQQHQSSLLRQHETRLGSQSSLGNATQEAELRQHE
jgi:hypothetical protein